MNAAVLTPNTLPQGAMGQANASHLVSPAVPNKEMQREIIKVSREKEYLEQQLRDTDVMSSALDIGNHASTIAVVGAPHVIKSTAKYMGPVGNVATGAFTIANASRNNTKEFSKLINDYKPDLQDQFGVAPNEAKEAHLRALSEVPGFENLKKEVARIDHNVWRSGVTTAAGIGAPAAVGTLAAAAGIAAAPATGGASLLITGKAIAGSIAASIAGSIAADKAYTAFSGIDPNDTAYRQAEALDARLDQGVPLTSAQVFGVLIKNNDTLQKEIKDEMGKPFHKLDESTQSLYMQRRQPQLNAASEVLANKINTGDMEVKRLLTLNLLAMQQYGAEGAHMLTQNDIMAGEGKNVVGAQNAPQMQVSPEGATIEPMQGREMQRIEGAQGPHSAAVLAAQQQQGVAQQSV